MRVTLAILLAVLAAAAIFALPEAADPGRWAAAQQRAFQNEMAAAVRALRDGAPGAWAALMGAAAAYGFVHAVGPGHGKFVIGGVGLGLQVRAGRLLGIAVAASLAQALWAILLVYGGFALLELTARRMTALAEDWLAPASYLAIAAVGGLLVWRGARALRRQVPAHAHDHGPCCGHAHAPAPEAVAGLTSLREAAALILGIAIRPCTGAIFLLVIAWQMEITTAGAAAVIAMGLGTAVLTSLVAVSSVAARGLAVASGGWLGAVAPVAAALQLVAGLAILWLSLALLRQALA